MKSCRPVVRNGYSTLRIRSISPQNAEKFSGLWDNVQSLYLRRPIQFHNGWLLHFSCYCIWFQLFVLSFHQLTASCNQLVTAGLGNTIKLPPQLQHKSSFTFLLLPWKFHRINKSASKPFHELPHHSRDYWLSSKCSFLHGAAEESSTGILPQQIPCQQGAPAGALWSPFTCQDDMKPKQQRQKGQTRLSPQCILNGAGPLFGPLGTLQPKQGNLLPNIQHVISYSVLEWSNMREDRSAWTFWDYHPSSLNESSTFLSRSYSEFCST